MLCLYNTLVRNPFFHIFCNLVKQLSYLLTILESLVTKSIFDNIFVAPKNKMFLGVLSYNFHYVIDISFKMSVSRIKVSYSILCPYCPKPSFQLAYVWLHLVVTWWLQVKQSHRICWLFPDVFILPRGFSFKVTCLTILFPNARMLSACTASFDSVSPNSSTLYCTPHSSLISH